MHAKAYRLINQSGFRPKYSSNTTTMLVVCLWFNNYLHERTQATMADGIKSEFLELQKGVPQGSVIAPLLFTIYINNINDNMRNVFINVYADDTVLYSIAPTNGQAFSHLQSDFLVLQKTLSDFKLVLTKQNIYFSRDYMI
jgi:retron-type reverse transcriptase